jgi:hypothetical protein
VAFRRVMGIRPLGFRVAGAVAALATAAVGVALPALVQLTTLVLILVTTIAVEARWHRARTAFAPSR